MRKLEFLPVKLTTGINLVIVAIIALTLAIVIGTLANAAITGHYSRPYMVVENTRQSGQWTAHCHSITTDGSRHLYVFGGCLPPVHH